MKRIEVSSTNLKSVGYDLVMKILEVEFLNGSIYQYLDVSDIIYSELMNAESHGKYFNKNIKTEYEFAKIG
jgi:hypothetical protein